MKHHIIDGIGIGFFISLFLSIYMKEFLGLLIPVYMVYGIIAPLASAVFITIFITTDERGRKQAEKELYESFRS